MIDIKSEVVEPRQVQLTVVVSPERMDRAVEEAAQQVARRQRIAGYRPGKVPVRAVIARVGEEALREEAVERVLGEVVREAIRTEGIDPWANPEAEVISRDPLTIRALVPLAPEVELGDYSTLRVDPPHTAAIADADVDEVLEAWRGDQATLQTVDAPAETGDMVQVSLVAHAGEDTVFEHEALDLRLTPEDATALQLPPAVVEQLVGAVAGESRSFQVRYSEFWPEEGLRGADVDFEALVDVVMRRVPPELDDAFAREVADVQSLSELRDRVRDQLQVRAEIDARDRYVRELVEALVAKSRVSWPPIALEREVALAIAGLHARVERQGMKWERWLELQGRDAEQLWAEFEPQVASELTRRLVLGAFVAAEGLNVDEDEVAAEVERLRQPFSRTALRSLPSVEEMRRSTGSRMLTSRVVERLTEISVSNGAQAPAATAAGTGSSEDGEAAATSAEDPNDGAAAGHGEAG